MADDIYGDFTDVNARAVISHSMKTRKLIFTIMAMAVLGIALCAGGLYVYIILEVPRTNDDSCVMNLRTLAGANERWAVDEHKTANDMPTWEDLGPYLPHGDTNALHCRAGGTYAIGRLNEPPRCSFGGPGHRVRKGDW